MKGNSKLHFIIIALGVVLISIGTVLLISSDKNGSKDTNEEKEYKLDPEIKENIDEKEIQDVMKQLKAIKISESSLYGNNFYNVVDMNINELLITAFEDFEIVPSCSESVNKILLSEEMINEKLNKYVNRYISMEEIIPLIESNSLNLVQDKYCYTTEIVEDKLNVSNCHCTTNHDEVNVVSSKVIRAEKNSDFVYVYSKVAFGKYKNYTNSLDDKVDYYLNNDRIGEAVETLNSSSIVDQFGMSTPDSEPNWDLYNTYKYTFRIAGGSYYFMSCEKI